MSTLYKLNDQRQSRNLRLSRKLYVAPMPGSGHSTAVFDGLECKMGRSYFLHYSEVSSQRAPVNRQKKTGWMMEGVLSHEMKEK